MNKPNFLSFLFIILLVINFISCEEKEMEFKDIDEDEATAYNDSLETKLNKVGFVSKGKTWKAWNQYFKDCIQSVNLQRAEFAGYSNSIQVGNLRLKDGTAGFKLSQFLSPQEISSIVETKSNAAKGCNNRFLKDIGFSNSIGLSFLEVAEAELKAQANFIDGGFK